MIHLRIQPEQALFSLDLITDKVFILFKFSRAFKGEFTDYLNDYYLKGEKVCLNQLFSYNILDQGSRFTKSGQQIGYI